MTLMKKSVYIDTTIPCYYYDERDIIKLFKDVTRNWWDNERDKFDLFVSAMTIDELEEGNYPHKEDIKNLVENIAVLSVTPEIKRYVDVYIKNFVMPTKDVGDAYHLAIASLELFPEKESDENV